MLDHFLVCCGPIHIFKAQNTHGLVMGAFSVWDKHDLWSYHATH